MIGGTHSGDGAGSQTPRFERFEFGVLEWSLLHLEFWSGAAPLGCGAMPNTPIFTRAM
jgi:hypothetical protein